MDTVWFIIFCSLITIGCAISSSKKKLVLKEIYHDFNCFSYFSYGSFECCC